MATAPVPRPTSERHEFKPFVPPTQTPAELTVRAVALGAILGSFLGAQVASLVGRRTAYFLISLGSATLTCGVFLFTEPLAPALQRQCSAS